MFEDPICEIQRYREKSSDYCLVAIVLNEGERIRRQIEKMAQWSIEVDLVIVDGGSDDGSLETNHLREHDIAALVTVRVRGLGTGVRTAIAYALNEGYQGLVTVDGNGKDNLAGLPSILDELKDGIGLVQGSRFLPGGVHQNTPIDRLIGIKCFVAPLLSLVGGIRVTDPTNGFRGLGRSYLEDPQLLPLRNCFVGFNLQLYLVYRAGKLGHGFIEVPVGRSYPGDGSIPTKIVGWGPRYRFIKEFFQVLLGFYNPQSPNKV